MKKILIIKAGEKLSNLSTVNGDFEDWIMDSMGDMRSEFLTVSVAEDELLPRYERLKGVLVTGSAAMVGDRLDWIKRTAAWLQESTKQSVPILGICFGHQLLAHALGGKVAANPKGLEVGTVACHINAEAVDDDLFRGMCDLPVQASHRQAVIRLPDNAVCLASTEMDVNHAFRFGDSAWGVQFHPEFNASITREYIRYYSTDGHTQVLDSERKLKDCSETPEANSILKKFSEMIGIK